MKSFHAMNSLVRVNSIRLCLSSFFCFLILFSNFSTAQQLAFADNVPGTNSATGDPAQVLSTGSPRVVLKNGNSLVVLDKSGMIDPRSGSPYGLFEDDTRYLSRWQMKLNDKDPTLITSFIQGGYHGSFLYSMLDEILIQRDIVLYKGMTERISVSNFSMRPVHLKLSILHGTDFKDMFEVRGQKRSKFGQMQGYWIEGAQSDTPKGGEAAKSIIRSSYKGLDNRDYMSFITAHEKPAQVNDYSVVYELDLKPQETQSVDLRVDTSNTPEAIRHTLSFAKTKETADADYAAWRKDVPQFKIDWEPLNSMMAQSIADLYLLRQNTANGPCLAAGLPWYSTAFGRDQCVTALQTLPFMPDLSRDLLKVLAAYQGKKHDADTEEEAGRIMHELRLGEMALAKEISFRPYYGTVDATPLWLMLLSHYVEATGDLEFAKTHWQNVEAAVSYLNAATNPKDGFLYYGGKEGAALSNQGWKDSGDSIMHKSGELAKAPIAVCEVQGYLYDAYSGIARLAGKLGKDSLAAELTKRASALKDKFNSSFWMPSEKFVALAIDGTGQPCQVVSSNPGHLLSTSILDSDRSNSVADRLMKDDMFSGWGIRTLSTQERRYNPLSYHDGSIWPHDNAMVAEGMASIGKADYACTVLESLVQSAKAAPDARLPELFCGFPRNDFDAPVPYAVSCVPQAWAAGSLFQMMKSILGIKLIDNKISVIHPKLPQSVNSVSIDNLLSGSEKVKLTFTRDAKSGEVTVVSSSPSVSIMK